MRQRLWGAIKRKLIRLWRAITETHSTFAANYEKPCDFGAVLHDFGGVLRALGMEKAPYRQALCSAVRGLLVFGARGSCAVRLHFGASLLVDASGARWRIPWLCGLA